MRKNEYMETFSITPRKAKKRRGPKPMTWPGRRTIFCGEIKTS